MRIVSGIIFTDLRTFIVVESRVRLNPEVGVVAASFRVSTMSVLLGIGSVDVWLNTNSSTACTFSSARVLEKALKAITIVLMKRTPYFSLYTLSHSF